MAKITNKLQFQSYIFSTAKYDFSVYEKRILYRQIEIEQKLISQEALDSCIKIDVNLWGDKKYTIPISMLLGNDEKENTNEGISKNNARFKKAFKDLKSKNIEYEDEKEYSCFGVIDKFWIDKYGRNVTWQSDKRIVEAVMDFTKGWRMYELKIAFNLHSHYAMRFYELVANKTAKITYTADKVIEMFQLENKYRRISTGKHNWKLIELKILKKAQEELDKIAPYTFDYKFSKDYSLLEIIPIYQPQFATAKHKRDNKTEEKNLKLILTSKEIEIYLNEFGFTEQGLKNNYNLFEECKKTLPEDYSFFLFQEIRTSLARQNKKVGPGCILKIIKNQLEQYKNR